MKRTKQLKKLPFAYNKTTELTSVFTYLEALWLPLMSFYFHPMIPRTTIRRHCFPQHKMASFSHMDSYFRHLEMYIYHIAVKS